MIQYDSAVESGNLQQQRLLDTGRWYTIEEDGSRIEVPKSEQQYRKPGDKYAKQWEVDILKGYHKGKKLASVGARILHTRADARFKVMELMPRSLGAVARVHFLSNVDQSEGMPENFDYYMMVRSLAQAASGKDSAAGRQAHSQPETVGDTSPVPSAGDREKPRDSSDADPLSNLLRKLSLVVDADPDCLLAYSVEKTVPSRVLVEMLGEPTKTVQQKSPSVKRLQSYEVGGSQISVEVSPGGDDASLIIHSVN